MICKFVLVDVFVNFCSDGFADVVLILLLLLFYVAVCDCLVVFFGCVCVVTWQDGVLLCARWTGMSRGIVHVEFCRL